MNIRAAVIGAGFAGKGHTDALQQEGVVVEVVCGRTPGPVESMARELGVKNVRFDWREAIREFKPDLAVVATPAAERREMVEECIKLGCHVVCEKPFALNARDARAMLAAAERAGVRHGYAATGCYAHPVGYLRELLEKGAVGSVREIEQSRNSRAFRPMQPYHWAHRLGDGGGALYILFPHHLQMILRMTGASVLRARGCTTHTIDKVPMADDVHDFRDFMTARVDEEKALTAQWQPVEADTGYTVRKQAKITSIIRSGVI